MEIDKSRFNRPIAAIAAVIGASVMLSGCWGDGEVEASDPGPSTFCEILQQAGDSDCDGMPDPIDRYPGYNDLTYDSDADGVPDIIDLYPGGNDYGDDDNDGFANWIDVVPNNPNVTVPVVPSQAELQQRQAAAQTEANIERNNNVTEQQKEAQAELKNSNDNKDSDNDGISDPYDAQPNLPSYYDSDNDGVINSSDRQPNNGGWS